MKHLIFVVLMLIAPFFSQADEPAPAEVKINSFLVIDRDANLAELCGKVTGPIVRLVPIKITADPNTKSKGNYVAFSDNEGNFCQVLVTYSRRASAGLMGNQSSESVEASAVLQQ